MFIYIDFASLTLLSISALHTWRDAGFDLENRLHGYNVDSKGLTRLHFRLHGYRIGYTPLLSTITAVTECITLTICRITSDHRPIRLDSVTNGSAMRVTTSVSGDFKGVTTLPKQINFAAKQTTIQVAQEAQPKVIVQIKSDFHVRGRWYEQANRFGIHVRFTRNKDDLSSNVETLADWLEEHETGGTRTPDKHEGNLTIPQVGNERPRPTILSVVPRKLKARNILPNVSEFVPEIFRQGRIRLETSRLGRAGRTGKIKASRFFINKKHTAIFERTDDHHLILFYTMSHAVHIRRHSTVIDPTIKVVESRFGTIFNEKLANAIKTAK